MKLFQPGVYLVLNLVLASYPSGNYPSHSQSVVPRSAASASPGHLLEIQILRPLHQTNRITNSETLSSDLFEQVLCDSDAHSSLRTIDLLHSVKGKG